MGSVCKVTSMFLLERQGVMQVSRGSYATDEPAPAAGADRYGGNGAVLLLVQAVECCRTNRANNEGILLTGGAAVSPVFQLVQV